jgi:Rrf2 family iron-sulfur cluster assembly transcriptional regulator
VKLRRAGLVKGARARRRLPAGAAGLRDPGGRGAGRGRRDGGRHAQGGGRLGRASGSRAQSLTNRLWESLSAHVYVFLHQTRLSDVVENDLAPCPAVPSLFSQVVDEV